MNLINAYKKADKMGMDGGDISEAYGIIVHKELKFDISKADLDDVIDDILYRLSRPEDIIEAISSNNWEVIPKTKDLWVNIYQENSGGPFYTGNDTYETKAKAKKGACPSGGVSGERYVGPHKITVKVAA